MPPHFLTVHTRSTSMNAHMQPPRYCAGSRQSLDYPSYDELSLIDGDRERMKTICKQHGFDLDAPGFDPAIYG